MKIGIFTDPHYSSAPCTCGRRYNSQSLRKIREAYADFEAAGCELIVCLGDLIDTEPTRRQVLENLREIAQVMHSVAIPTVCLMGNHDAFALEPTEFYQTLGISPPRDIACNGRHLLFLDACYFSNGAHYRPGDSDWRNTFYPYEHALAEQLKHLSGEVYLFLHQNLDPTVRADHRLCNADRLMQILAQAHNVKAVFQGHYHAGRESEHHGIRYLTLPAMCEQEQAARILEI